MNENYPILKDQAHLRKRKRAKREITRRTAVVLVLALLLTGIATYMLFNKFDFGAKPENNNSIKAFFVLNILELRMHVRYNKVKCLFCYFDSKTTIVANRSDFSLFFSK